jgi:DNA-binding GntR family transcriptional regulator
MEEDWVLEKCGVNHNALIKALRVLELDGLLNFERSEGMWIIRLVHPRMRQLPLTPDDVERHRDRLMEKLRFMEGYVTTRSCRTAYIRRYFGETSVPESCGFCDRCLAASELDGVDAKRVAEVLKGLDHASTIAGLEQHLGLSRKVVKEVLSLLQREGRVTSDSSGFHKTS